MKSCWFNHQAAEPVAAVPATQPIGRVPFVNCRHGFLTGQLVLRTLILFTLMFVLGGCSASAAGGGNQEGRSLTVFAAASLTEAFRELGFAFEEQHPGTSIVFNFAGSQRLRTQLEQGARADVFASADWRQMQSLVESGLVSGEPVNFAGNQLVVITPSPRHSPASGEQSGGRVSQLEDLTRPGIKLVLASAEVPAGAYFRSVLENINDDARFGSKYSEGVLANLVSEETNVRNVAQKVALGEADAGIVYQTDSLIPEISARVSVIPIPAEFNVTASYPAAVMKEAKEPGLAKEFVSFLQTEAAQHILEQRGFARVGPLLPAGPDARGRTDR